MRVFPLLFVAVVSFSAPARSQPAAPVNSALVWGGGKTAKEAEAALARWSETAMVAREQVRLAEGYPKALESAKVKGLKPGFHVVLLGLCTEAEAQRFAGAMQGMGPGSYVRKVEAVAGAKSECPQLLEAKGTAGAKAKLADGGTVSVAVFHPVKAAGAHALVFLFDAQGAEYGYAKIDLFEKYPAACTGVEVAGKGEAVVVKARCCQGKSGFAVSASLGLGDEGPAILDETETPASKACE